MIRGISHCPSCNQMITCSSQLTNQII